MNLNKFLCSHFEPNKDGKVTIGNVADIVVKLLFIAFLSCLIIIWIGGVSTYFCENVGILTEQDITRYVVDGDFIASGIFFLCAGLLILLSIIVVIAVVLLITYMVAKICSIPIATCKVAEKKGDTKSIEGKEQSDEE